MTDEADAIISALRKQVERLETERKELNARLQDQTKKAQRLGKACTDREKRITALEVQLRKARGPRNETSEESADRGDLTKQLSELEGKYRELAAYSAQERRRYEEEVASLTRQISELRQHYEARISEMGDELQRRVDWPGNREPRMRAANGQPSQAVAQPQEQRNGLSFAEEPAPHIPAAEPLSSNSGLLIVDSADVGEEIRSRLKKFGYPLIAFDPDRDVDTQIADQGVACAVLNLATSTTWKVARSLRSNVATAEVPIIAYALAQLTEAAFWFGHIDIVPLPLKYAGLPDVLRRMSSRLKHVILIGLRDDLAEEVRGELAQNDITSELVYDRRGALAAVRGKYPQASIVYALSNPVDGFRTIAAIRGMAIFRDLPSVFLLSEKRSEREEELLSSGARTLLRLASLRLEQLVDQVASAANAAKAAVNAGP
jgi:CheY-like chemotaxis protein